MNFGMIRFMRKSLAFYFALVFCFNLIARESTLLDSDWYYLKGDDWTGAQWWDPIRLPDNWGWELAQIGYDYYRGPSWYRRRLDIQLEPGKRYFLRFEGASLVTDVFLNGKIGEHRGGFGAFCFEITSALSPGGTNLLAVSVNDKVEPDIAPLSGDFPVFGGLYRPVKLIVTSAENFALTDHGSPGVAWLQTNVTPERAVLDVTAKISNGTGQKQALTWVTRVLDADGKTVTESNQQVVLAPNVTAPYGMAVTVPHPHLWNGRLDPYLYQAVVELRSGDSVVDSVTQPLGLRFYSVDPEKGFLLNGKLYPLHGVNKYQDRFNKGWAVSDADLDEDMALIKEIGATVVRCAHYQHSDYFYSLCDKAGILVWAEIPQVNEIGSSKQFEDTTRNQLLDLIRQNINHPSIFAWSLFNEIGLKATPDPRQELQNLNDVAHKEDLTRPTIAATCTDKFSEMNKIPDLLGWNFDPGWYTDSSSLTNFSQVLDSHRDDGQQGGFCVSKYGAEANVNQHEQDPKQPKSDGQWHPEEWQSEVHEAAWAAMKQKPFVWGTFVWTMFDFAVSTRHEGDVPGRNEEGLVTFDRKTKKDVFYFYKANWSDEPVLYITSRRFTGRTNAATNVKVYSNAKEVELWVDGVSQSKNSNGTNCVFVWNKIGLKPGENEIEVKAVRNGTSLTDNCIWNLK